MSHHIQDRISTMYAC